jgi:hypothetical protein
MVFFADTTDADRGDTKKKIEEKKVETTLSNIYSILSEWLCEDASDDIWTSAIKDKWFRYPKTILRTNNKAKESPFS